MEDQESSKQDRLNVLNLVYRDLLRFRRKIKIELEEIG